MWRVSDLLESGPCLPWVNRVVIRRVVVSVCVGIRVRIWGRVVVRSCIGVRCRILVRCRV